MPEIGEVARIVHYLRKHLVNRTINACTAFDDDIVYGKVGTTAKAFQDAVTGRKVTGAAQQGKYFYVTFDKPPHAVMHFGMTGWVKFNCEDTAYYKQAKEKDTTEEWPPRFMKFLLKCNAEADGLERDDLEVAFVDPRRLGRIRLVDCDADKIREVSPLKENGPDPVRDENVVTTTWLAELLRRKRVPVKALLLDQANLSGVGNWVADEVLYQALIHPEQYSNSFDDAQIKRLHDSLVGVCRTAVETLADSTKFPDHWIMKYRWDKGKKDANVLPNGQKIVHLKVGGRTSAIVPSVQKKTAAVAGDVDFDDLDEKEDDDKPAKGRKRKSNMEEVEVQDSSELPKESRGSRGRKSVKVKEEGEAKAKANGGAAQEKKRSSSSRSKVSTPKKAEKPPTPGSRRSKRNKAN